MTKYLIKKNFKNKRLFQIIVPGDLAHHGGAGMITLQQQSGSRQRGMLDVELMAFILRSVRLQPNERSHPYFG